VKAVQPEKRTVDGGREVKKEEGGVTKVMQKNIWERRIVDELRCEERWVEKKGIH
jgi:hypothetical protein